MLFLSNPYHSSAERHKATLNHRNSLLCFSVSNSLRHGTKQINVDAFLFSALPSPLLSLRCYAISTRILSVQRHSHAMQLIANPFRITSGLRNSFSLRHMALLHLTLPSLCISVLIFAHAEPVQTLPSPVKSMQCPRSTLPLLTLPSLCDSTPVFAIAQLFVSSLSFSIAELLSDFFPCEAALSGISPLTDAVQNSGVEPFSDVLLKLRIERSDIEFAP